MKYWTKHLNGSKADLKAVEKDFKAVRFILHKTNSKNFRKGVFLFIKLSKILSLHPEFKSDYRTLKKPDFES